MGCSSIAASEDEENGENCGKGAPAGLSDGNAGAEAERTDEASALRRCCCSC